MIEWMHECMTFVIVTDYNSFYRMMCNDRIENVPTL
jgi:hypothetical protein